MGCAFANDAAAAANSPRDVLDDPEVIPDAVDRGVDAAPRVRSASALSNSRTEDTDARASAAASALFGSILEPSRERRYRFAELPRAGLRDAEVDDAGDVPRLGRERRLRFRDRLRIRERAILDARGRLY
jgi:hypothetical protein